MTGNGNRDRIYDIFNKSTNDIDLTIFDYYQKSRYEELKEIRDKELAVKQVDRDEYYKMVAKRKKEAEERYKRNGHRRY